MEGKTIHETLRPNKTGQKKFKMATKKSSLHWITLGMTALMVPKSLNQTSKSYTTGQLPKNLPSLAWE